MDENTEAYPCGAANSDEVLAHDDRPRLASTSYGRVPQWRDWVVGVVDMSYIDVLIPGMIGVLLVTSPRLFTKAEGEKYDQTKAKLRTIGLVLIGVAILYLIVKVVGKT